MVQRIKIGIIGYGNLGRGVEAAVESNPDMELIGVFTRRDPESLTLLNPKAKVFDIEKAQTFIGKIDVMILCGGSATDLPNQGPRFAQIFNTVDSYDNHGKIPEYFDLMDSAAQKGHKVSLISAGWDPGLFSLNRLLYEAVLPMGNSYTFWGKGISQGHSDAIRRISGVADGVQYTIPKKESIERVRMGGNPLLSTREKHLRRCYVVAEDAGDKGRIEDEIKNMPNYFADYETEVIFVDEEELRTKHKGMPHGGRVIRSGQTGTGEKHRQTIEFSLELESNPEFTGSVMVSYARAVHKMAAHGEVGAKTVLDVPPGLMSLKSPEDLRKELL